MTGFLKLKEQAQSEAYEYFDKNIRRLSKTPDNKVDPFARDLQDNDADAFRHAYVSGVFTQEYGGFAADVFGRLNEFMTADLYSNSRDPRALNMDLWNNGVGRTNGKKTRDRKTLLIKIHEAIKKGELIVHPSDSREYKGARNNPEDDAQYVLVLDENKSGRNELFLDLTTKMILTRDEFIASIQAGEHPQFSIRNVDGLLVPISKPDQSRKNNLG